MRPRTARRWIYGIAFGCILIFALATVALADTVNLTASWSLTPDSRTTGLELYRYTSQTAPGELVSASIPATATSWAFSATMTSGQTMWFRIRVKGGAGQFGALSTWASLTYTPGQAGPLPIPTGLAVGLTP
jgi:hypothetical protein